MGSEVVAHAFSCSMACRIFPDQGSNLCLLHWQVVDSLPLSHQGSPCNSCNTYQKLRKQYRESQCNFHSAFLNNNILSNHSMLSKPTSPILLGQLQTLFRFMEGFQAEAYSASQPLSPSLLPRLGACGIRPSEHGWPSPAPSRRLAESSAVPCTAPSQPTPSVCCSLKPWVAGPVILWFPFPFPTSR